MPDVGATLHLIEFSTNKRAIRMGKPETYCLNQILSDHFPE